MNVGQDGAGGGEVGGESEWSSRSAESSDAVHTNKGGNMSDETKTPNQIHRGDVMSATARIEVVEIATGKVVHTIPLSGIDPALAGLVMRGLLANLDRTAFFAREVLR